MKTLDEFLEDHEPIIRNLQSLQQGARETKMVHADTEVAKQIGGHPATEQGGMDPDLKAKWVVYDVTEGTESYSPTIATVMRNKYLRAGDAEANARLISAAPDLLEAVQELLATHPAAHRKANKIDNRTDNAVRIARAVVLKAKGEVQ